MDSFKVVIDTREKEEYRLQFASSKISEVIVSKLDTGDYSIVGMENILCIERKLSLVEFYGNISQERFWNEMTRMQQYKYRFLVLQFTPADVQAIPYSLNVGKAIWSKMKITPQYVFKCISDIQIKYGVNVLFAQNQELAEIFVINIMKRVYESESKSSG